MKAYGLALLAGLPLALSHDIGGPLALVALAPLFWLARQHDGAFRLGLIAGFTETFLAMWGCSSYGLVIPALLGIQGGMVRGLTCWLLRYRGPWPALAMLVVGQWLRTQPPFAIPISVGHDLLATPFLAQPAALGGGALLVAVCGLSALAVVDRFLRPKLLGLLLLIYGLASAYDHLMPLSSKPMPLKIAGIQGGLPNWVYAQSWVDPKSRELIRHRYLDAARLEAERGAELVILPESAVRENWGEDNPMTRAYQQIHDRGAGLVAGLNHRRDGEWRNSALLWDPEATKPDILEKQIVVPIVERSFRAGAESKGELPFKGMATAICIESIYPSIFAGMPQARWGLVITNDAGVGATTPRRAFERETRLRAVELGLPILRLGQDGYSYLVDGTGRLREQLPEHGPGVLRIEELPPRRATLFAWLGNWLVALALGFLVFSLAFRFRRQVDHESSPPAHPDPLPEQSGH